MTDLGIFMIGIVVTAIALGGTVAAVMAGSVEEDRPETARPKSERGN